jgi:hypothetical protein
MPLEMPFPGADFLCRSGVTLAGLLERQLPSAERLEDGNLARGRPSLGVWWRQFVLAPLAHQSKERACVEKPEWIYD